MITKPVCDVVLLRSVEFLLEQHVRNGDAQASRTATTHLNAVRTIQEPEVALVEAAAAEEPEVAPVEGVPADAPQEAPADPAQAEVPSQ